ncbi:MAG: hypothetical protein HY812_19065 [Planctomycetes bacterium]|nr:hypothetical protein [Planctomycetota bacterium]
MARLGARIERWRATRQKRWPMPAPLWERAVALAQRHGVGPIARGLRLDYYSLKRRLGGPRTASHGAVEGERAFVEVDLVGVRGSEECRIEVPGGDGAS